MIPEPVDVDIQKITESSLLITGFGPLGSETLIAFEKTKQNEQKHPANCMKQIWRSSEPEQTWC